MTKDELIKALAEKTDISEDQALSVINAFTNEVKTQLQKGEKVLIPGFGTFILSHRKPRTFVNPKTGETRELPEKFLPHFKAGEELKKNLQS